MHLSSDTVKTGTVLYVNGPLFDFSYVLIRDFVLDLDDEEAGLKHLEHVMDELRRVYDEIQDGTHGKSPHPGMEVPDYTHLFAPEQARANFVAPGRHPIEQFHTPRMLTSLRRFLETRIALGAKNGFPREEWKNVQVPLDRDEPDRESDDDGEAFESGARFSGQSSVHTERDFLRSPIRVSTLDRRHPRLTHSSTSATASSS